MTKNQKLELVWIGKENRPRLEPRILLEDPEKSHHAAHRATPNDLFDNRLIFGDNLLALKALEQEFTGKVQCIYIDPPYNTGSAFAHYDDGVEHSLWLSLMRDRIELLKRLLSKTGAIFAQIDDNEGHYLKLLMDEVFGRDNFVTSFVWQKVDSPNDNKVPITPDHEYILCFAKDKGAVRFFQMADPSVLEAYRNRDEENRLYRDRLLKKNGKNSLREDRPSMFFGIRAPDGRDVLPIHDDGREACWALGKKAVDELVRSGELIWKNRGTAKEPKWVPYTREYAPEDPVRPFATMWLDVQTSRQAKKHQRELFGVDVPPFDTPKPEPLIQRILELCTAKGDLVLDSFAGSGTTGAVAHKMGRRWLMIELGEHCHSHIVPRLTSVIDGQDQGGITAAVKWKGGGGFRYFRLAPSLLRKDRWGNQIVNKEYNASMLAEAVCKLEGFAYAPSEVVFWQHGYSTERDFIYVTTQKLTREQLEALSEEVGEDRSLLVCCAAFRTKSDTFPNLTIKKIPNAVLARCEWGHDDYSLQIKNLPSAPDLVPGEEMPPGRRKTKKAAAGSMPLFDSGDDR